MRDKIEEVLKPNRAFNYLIIKEMWHYKYHNYGSNVSSNIDENSIYSQLGKVNTTLNIIINGGYTYKKDNVMKDSCNVASRTGIPATFLMGEELIILPGLDEEFVKKYMEIRDDVNSEDQIICEKFGYPSMRNLLKNIDIIKKNSNNILLCDMLEARNKLAHMYEEKQHKLKKAIEEFLTMEGIKDTKLYNLKRFINKEKPTGTLNKNNIWEITNILQNTHYKNFLDIKEELEEYIITLEQHLELANAAFRIAVDTGQLQKKSR